MAEVAAVDRADVTPFLGGGGGGGFRFRLGTRSGRGGSGIGLKPNWRIEGSGDSGVAEAGQRVLADRFQTPRPLHLDLLS